ncbi:hypothetical protein V8D89_016274, partial [Ganoderma adspersum]
MPVWALNATGGPAHDRLPSGLSGRPGWQGVSSRPYVSPRRRVLELEEVLKSSRCRLLTVAKAGLHAGVIDGEDSGAGVSGRKVSAD